MSIIIPRLMPKGMNEGAYRGNLLCPTCHSKAVRFIENLGPYRIRYRCRKCGLLFQYEIGRDMSQHPYAVLNKNKWRDIADAYAKGRKLKE
jgi:transposase-like protein